MAELTETTKRWLAGLKVGDDVGVRWGSRVEREYVIWADADALRVSSGRSHNEGDLFSRATGQNQFGDTALVILPTPVAIVPEPPVAPFAGKLTPAWTVTCGGCGAEILIRQERGNSQTKVVAATLARQRYTWSETAARGWVCPGCKTAPKGGA